MARKAVVFSVACIVKCKVSEGYTYITIICLLGNEEANCAMLIMFIKHTYETKRNSMLYT